jgi:ubiquinone/menaquinone biosynthesis C-methylase UbiE
MSLPAYAAGQASFPEMYERWLVEPLFKPWAESLLDRVALTSGDRVIDIGCGTGIVARIAKQRLGEAATVVGVDVSPQMLAVSRAVAPAIDWREGSAMALPVGGSEAFDVVVCQQGLQFMTDKAAAAREMRRVIAPGGRLGVATWRPADEIPIFHDLQRVAERRFGPIADQRHAYGDGNALRQLFTEAGFQAVRVETESKTIVFADGTTFVRLNTMALAGMSAGAKAMADAERAGHIEAIIQDSEEIRARYSDGARLSFEISSNVLTARG